MERLAPRGHVGKLTYSAALFPWRYAVGTALGCHDMERLHEYAGTPCVSSEHKRLQSSVWHARFYLMFDGIVGPLYKDFLRWLSQGYGPLVYQAKPSLRVHLPGDVAVHEWHRDGDYGHQDGELNVWLPVTPAFATSTVWVNDKPQNADYGEAVLFDGVNLLHGNKVNETGKTRVSLDFRIAPKGFDPSGKASVHAGRQFIVGPAYFEELV
jgi:hypothetical protein